MSQQAHPAFWWIWAVLFATALIQQNSLAYTALALVVITFIAISVTRKIGIPPHRRKTLFFAIRIGFISLGIRLFFATAIGVPLPGQTLFTLPTITLPKFLVGIRIGGPVTEERLFAAFSQGLIFATIIAIFGLANSLSTPAQLIKIMPRRMYGLGVATTLATTITPNIAKGISRIRTAQYLRGQPNRGIASWRRIGTPVLEEALAHSIDLAAAMEARGYGISKAPTRYRAQRWRPLELIAITAVAYLVVLFPFLELNALAMLAIFISLAVAPAVLP